MTENSASAIVDDYTFEVVVEVSQSIGDRKSMNITTKRGVSHERGL